MRYLIASWLLLGCGGSAPVASLGAGGTAPVLSAEVASSGPARDRVAVPDDAQLVLFYGGEQMGSMDTCGCPKRPRGSLARVEGYREASRKVHDAPDLLLNTGNWLDDTIGLDGQLRQDVWVMNDWMVQGLEAGGWDALNVTFRDLPWLEASGRFPPAAVSANIRPVADGVEGFATHRLLEAGGQTVAVTGVSREGMSFLQPESYAFADPVAAVEALLPELTASADLVVVLAFDVRERMNELAALDGVDVIIEGGEFHGRWQPHAEGDLVWVRSHYQTQRLGELRLRHAGGRVLAARDRQIDLDEEIPSDRALARMSRDARADIEDTKEGPYAAP